MEVSGVFQPLWLLGFGAADVLFLTGPLLFLTHVGWVAKSLHALTYSRPNSPFR